MRSEESGPLFLYKGKGENSMNSVNKTLYIPLYGKSYVSKKGIILKDTKAEEIWKTSGFPLKGKSKSKWLAYYMGMRSKVFDNWLKEQMEHDKDAVIFHIGCGMDSRIERVGTKEHDWFDVDFPDVIAERRQFYKETDKYHMVESDARENAWIQTLPADKNAIILMEGVSMYFQLEELKKLLAELCGHFNRVHLLMDCYTVFAAKASKYKNPINEVGVTTVYGFDEPRVLEDKTGLSFVEELDLTPTYLVDELRGMEKAIFKKVFAGDFAKKMYRLFEFEGINGKR